MDTDREAKDQSGSEVAGVGQRVLLLALFAFLVGNAVLVHLLVLLPLHEQGQRLFEFVVLLPIETQFPLELADLAHRLVELQ